MAPNPQNARAQRRREGLASIASPRGIPPDSPRRPKFELPPGWLDRISTLEGRAAETVRLRREFLGGLLGALESHDILADRAIDWLSRIRQLAPPLTDFDVVALAWSVYHRLMNPIGKPLTRERMEEVDLLADLVLHATFLADHYAKLFVGYYDPRQLQLVSGPFRSRFIEWMRQRHQEDKALRVGPATERQVAILRVMMGVSREFDLYDEEGNRRAIRVAARLLKRDALRRGAGAREWTEEEILREIEARWWTSDTPPYSLYILGADGRRRYNPVGIRDVLRECPETAGAHRYVPLEARPEDPEGAAAVLPELPAHDAEDPLDAAADVDLARAVQDLRGELTTPGERAALRNLLSETQAEAMAAEGCSRKALRNALPRVRERVRRALGGFSA